MELKDRLKLARKNAGITQAQVAEAITGLSQPAYSELERGISKSTSKIVELASLYEVNPEWLSSGTGEMINDDIRSDINSPVGDYEHVVIGQSTQYP
ncbi:helix-turn-helix transcriptional regulator, partial [Mycobacterium tuberculosis]|nr:helix-turn-helix transcriptional regulator [Mycobacterium tuberculosis]